MFLKYLWSREKKFFKKMCQFKNLEFYKPLICKLHAWVRSKAISQSSWPEGIFVNSNSTDLAVEYGELAGPAEEAGFDWEPNLGQGAAARVERGQVDHLKEFEFWKQICKICNGVKLPHLGGGAFFPPPPNLRVWEGLPPQSQTRF